MLVHLVAVNHASAQCAVHLLGLHFTEEACDVQQKLVMASAITGKVTPCYKTFYSNPF